MKRVLIIGGYGNFGQFISKALAADSQIQVIIGGRSLPKAQALSKELKSVNQTETERLDINNALETSLAKINPDIVIHTSGPFQAQSYHVAEACIAQGCDYIDLADGRKFVEDITNLDKNAKANNTLVISGASSVPCLTSALVDHYIDEFQQLEKLDFGITTAQKTSRGEATTAAILSYTGKPFNTLINGKTVNVFGWQNIHARTFPKLGKRLLGNCEIPDLSLFPKRYPQLKTVRFYAGIEIPFIHTSLWLISWLVRIGLITKLEKTAGLLLKIAAYFDRFGSNKSAFYMSMIGTNQENKKKTITFELTALSGDGPYVPCMPAILLAKKLARNEISKKGAYPCVGFITLGEYLSALEPLDISWETNNT